MATGQNPLVSENTVFNASTVPTFSFSGSGIGAPVSSDTISSMLG